MSDPSLKATRRAVLLGSGAALASPAGAASRRAAAWKPKLSENLSDVEPSTLRWLKQLGCEHVVFQGTERVDSGRKGYWSMDDIAPVKKACEAAGLKLESMMLQQDLYRRTRFGQPGSEEEIENVCRTIRTVAEAGVPMLEWRWVLEFLWDQRVGYYNTGGRGGSTYRSFDYDRVRSEPPLEGIGQVEEAELWDRLIRFARPVIAAAEKAGVRMSLHPNDPPVPSMRGAARLFYHPDKFRRFQKEVPSPANGMTFCQGTFTEMGINVLEEIRYFGKQNRIQLVHFRAVRGKVPRYTEVFIDEGDVDMLDAMKAYKDAGYAGLMVSDHTPRVESDTRWGHVGRAYSIGYLQALAHAAAKM